MAVPLLTVMLIITYIHQGASLHKSTAADFLQPVREKRSAECLHGGCSTESASEEEGLIEVDASYIPRQELLRLDTISLSFLKSKQQQLTPFNKCHFTMSTPNSGPEGSGMAQGNRRLQQTQAQVDEVVDIMRVNVDKVLERDQKLSELDDRADALQAGASQFETSAAKLKRKFWWKNCKMWAILIAVIIIIVIIIVVMQYT
ncbi:hypothetical protein NHX12_029884 [Muraenolepis orangiensis]|uniref:V-SNARE coiled-coil homology domain-containing protein n=1 Tax=Muraenolepis orangiensis TaxID=630683 RepID=A0A9Q0IL71_9TELE|nr:hypothetical protein NHX12_029884 [Muraenolepis orangiensis]